MNKTLQSTIKCFHCGKIVDRKNAIVTARKNNEVFCSLKCVRTSVFSLWLEPWGEEEENENDN